MEKLWGGARSRGITRVLWLVTLALLLSAGWLIVEATARILRMDRLLDEVESAREGRRR